MERAGPPFSPPAGNQLARKKRVPQELRRVAVWAALSSLLQGLLWTAACGLAIAVYDDDFTIPTYSTYNGTSGYFYLLIRVYFNETSISGLPSEGLFGSSGMNIMMILFAAGNGLWFIVAAAVLVALRWSSVAAGFFWLYCWMFCCSVVTVLDVVLAALMVRDLVVLGNWDDSSSFTYSSFTMLLMCPGGMLIFAARAGVLFILNVVLLMVVARRTAQQRTLLLKARRQQHQLGYRPSVVDREGPIDAFLYRNRFMPGSSEGTLNPVYVPDEEINWMTFKTPQGRPDEPATIPTIPRVVNVMPRQRPVFQRPLSKQDDEDDVSHLTWMAEVDKYINPPPAAADPTQQANNARDLRMRLQRQQSLRDESAPLPRAWVQQQASAPPLGYNQRRGGPMGPDSRNRPLRQGSDPQSLACYIPPPDYSPLPNRRQY